MTYIYIGIYDFVHNEKYLTQYFFIFPREYHLSFSIIKSQESAIYIIFKIKTNTTTNISHKYVMKIFSDHLLPHSNLNIFKKRGQLFLKIIISWLHFCFVTVYTVLLWWLVTRYFYYAQNMNTYWLKGLSPNERLYENIIQHPHGLRDEKIIIKKYNEIHRPGKKKRARRQQQKNKIRP